MSTKGRLLTVFTLLGFTLLFSCAPPPSEERQLQSTATGLVPASAPADTSAPPAQASSSRPSITGVTWDTNQRSISIDIGGWPQSWSPWKLYVDGIEVPTTEEGSGIVVRPNAPLDRPPTGLIIGTLPWVSGLQGADLPCCGSMQFSVPGAGMTDPFDYNLRDAGCLTASAKVCPAEWAVHEGDWIIQGAEVLENTKLIQRGNIHIRNSASLAIINSELQMERGATPTIHVYIFVDPGGALLIDNSKVHPGPGDGGLTCVWNRGSTQIVDSPTNIHYFDMGERATLTMDNSSMIYEIGGLLQVAGGTTRVSNSTLGALGLSVPAGAHLSATGLRSGTTFEQWKVQDLIPEASYELTFDHVSVLKDDWTGEYEHGPFERGWIFFLDPNAHVRLSDSEVRKIFLDLRGDSSEFNSLRIGEPSDLAYRDILLENVTAKGEWSFTLTDASATFRDSTYLFLQPSGSSTLKLIDSHMVEFIPRGFTGTISFENASWTNAGEILGGVDYHSGSNDFRMTGSLKLGSELRTNLQWKDARVTREFDVILTDPQGAPIPGALIRFGGGEYLTDEAGRARFSVIFDESNYAVPALLEAVISGSLVGSRPIDFFTETPVRMTP